MRPSSPAIVGLKRVRRFILGAVLPVGLLILWEWAVATGAWPRSIMASPSEVVTGAFAMMASGELLGHALVSLRRLLLGFFIGAILGVLIGLSVGVWRIVEEGTLPLLRILAPIPPIAWIPLLVILLGIGEVSKVTLIAIGSFFVVFANTFDGVRGTDQRLVEVALGLRKQWPEMVTRIFLPSAAASIFTGGRVALGLSWILLIAAEVIASSRGLGWLIWDSRNFSRPDEMLVGMIAVACLGAASDFLLGAMARTSLGWRTSYRAR